jgi:hypothetical protein
MNIKPYIAKQFKIIDVYRDKKPDDKSDHIYVDYVEPISDTDKNDIVFLLEKPVVYEKQISIDEFTKRFKDIYESVQAAAPTVKIEEPKISSNEAILKKEEENQSMLERKAKIKERLEKAKENKPTDSPKVPDEILNRKIEQVKYADKKEQPIMTMTDMIKEVPLKLLINEIRRRQLSEKMSGQLIVDNQKVSFNLTELKWPTGVYEIDITLTKDITDDYINTQKQKQEKEKQAILLEGSDK